MCPVLSGLSIKKHAKCSNDKGFHLLLFYMCPVKGYRFFKKMLQFY